MLRKLALRMAAAMLLLVPALSAAKANELFVYNWSNYFPPDLIEKFEQETGIKVTLDTYASNDDLLAKLQAGAAGYDVAFPSDYMVEIMINDGLLQKIDAASMENFKHVAAPHDAPYYDPERAYSAPYMWGTTGLAYDSARVDADLEQTWKEFFEPRDSLKGQIAALNSQAEMYSAAAYYLGIDDCTEDPAEAQQILDLLKAQKPHLAMYSSTGTIDRMIAGEVVMHHMWNGAAHRVKKEKSSVNYLYPKEGVPFWADNMVVPKDAPNVENAKTFINWMLDPKNAAAASNYTGYMNAINGSSEYLDDTLKADPAVNMPPEFANRLVMSPSCSTKARELRDKVWTSLKN
jgi:spermidine/putrescine transport system substrate-binding protein